MLLSKNWFLLPPPINSNIRGIPHFDVTRYMAIEYVKSGVEFTLECPFNVSLPDEPPPIGISWCYYRTNDMKKCTPTPLINMSSFGSDIHEYIEARRSRGERIFVAGSCKYLASHFMCDSSKRICAAIS